MPTGDVQRDLGRLESRMDSLERGQTDMKADLKIVVDTLSQARGGWKTLMLVAGVAGAFGAVAGKLTAMLGFMR